MNEKQRNFPQCVCQLVTVTYSIKAKSDAIPVNIRQSYPTAKSRGSQHITCWLLYIKFNEIIHNFYYLNFCHTIYQNILINCKRINVYNFENENSLILLNFNENQTTLNNGSMIVVIISATYKALVFMRKDIYFFKNYRWVFEANHI